MNKSPLQIGKRYLIKPDMGGSAFVSELLRFARTVLGRTVGILRIESGQEHLLHEPAVIANPIISVSPHFYGDELIAPGAVNIVALKPGVEDQEVIGKDDYVNLDRGWITEVDADPS